jgi:hypothetical protein
VQDVAEKIYDALAENEALAKRRATNKLIRDTWRARVPVDNGKRRDMEARKAIEEKIAAWYKAADLIAVLEYDIPRLGFLKIVAEVENNPDRAEVNQTLIDASQAKISEVRANEARLVKELQEVLGVVS